MALKGQWKLSGGVYTDTSGNGYNLTKTGTVSNATGFLGGANTAISIAGGNGNYLAITDRTGLRGAANISVTCRLKISSFAAFQMVLGKHGASALEYALSFNAGSGNIVLSLSTNGTSWTTSLTSTTTLSTGIWYCCVMVYDGTNARIYIDDMVNADASVGATGSIYGGTGSFWLGANNNGNNDLNGSIDDVQFFNHALSADERNTYKNYGENFVGYFLPATVGTFNLTSISTNLIHAYFLPTTVTPFNLTSISTGLIADRKLPITTKDFTLTGNNVLFDKTYPLSAQTGTFTLSSIDTLFVRSRKMTAVSGTFDVTGINIGFGWSNHIVADVRSFAFVGNTVNFIAGHGIPISAGAFTLTSVDALFLQKRSLGADVRSYYLAGQNIGLTTSGSNLEKLTWRLIDSSGNPITGVVPTIIIRRSNDGAFYDWDDGIFKLSGLTTIAGDMIAVDVTNLPGTYEKTLNILNFNGKYQVFAKYVTTISQYSTVEFQVENSVIWTRKVATDLTSITNRLPSSLINGRMDSSVGSNLDKAGYDITQEAADKVWSATAIVSATSTAIDAIWDEELKGSTHNITTSAGKRLRQLGAQAVMSGTLPVQTGMGKTQIKLDIGASSTPNIYDEALIVIDTGTAIGEGHHILYYDGVNRIAYIDDTLITQPASGDTYQIYAVSAIDGLTGMVSAGNTASTIVFTSNASASNDYYNNQTVMIASGTGQGQRRRITGYVGATKTATVSPNWVVTPSDATTGDGVSTYILYNGTPVQVDTNNDKTGYAIGIGGITSSSFSSNSIDAATLSSDAVTEIWSKVVESQGSYTAQQVMSIILSVLAGVTDQTGTALKTPDGIATRVAATIDGSNNRTAMTLTPST